MMKMMREVCICDGAALEVVLLIKMSIYVILDFYKRSRKSGKKIAQTLKYTPDRKIMRL